MEEKIWDPYLKRNLTIREKIIYTLISVDVDFDEGFVDEIEEIVRKKDPRYPLSFAYAVARNKGIDKKKREEAAKKRKRKRILQNEKRRQERLAFEDARNEFWQAFKKMTSVKNLSGIQYEYIWVLWLRVFEEKTYSELRRIFPHRTLGSLRKEVERGRKMIKPFSSSNLKKFLLKKWKIPPSYQMKE